MNYKLPAPMIYGLAFPSMMMKTGGMKSMMTLTLTNPAGL